MTIDLYYLPGSAPCRAVLMTAKAVGVELNLKLLNLMAGEHLKPEFVKLNPQHTIPTLVDGDLVLWESRAIMIYLVEKYGKTDSLYPKDPAERAVVNQRLYFDMGTLYDRYSTYYYPQFFAKQPPNHENYKKMQEALKFFDTFLEGQLYAAGDTLTLADISLVATVSTFEASGFDLAPYPNVDIWLGRCKETAPGYNLNEDGIREFQKFLTQK